MDALHIELIIRDAEEWDNTDCPLILTAFFGKSPLPSPTYRDEVNITGGSVDDLLERLLPFILDKTGVPVS